MSEFLDKTQILLNKVDKEENENILKASKIMFDALIKQDVVHVFATGHSHMFAEELFYRAGGLVGINPILVPMLMQHEGAIRSTKLERLTGLAKTIYDSIDLKENEPFIIVSNSGINSVPVEMAKIAKENNHSVIVITSVESSKNLTPRTKDNKRLLDFGDVVIDNHVPYGDCLIGEKDNATGAVSSIICNFIAQRLVIEVVKQYTDKGITAPIYKSANTPFGDEHNQKLYETYKSRIKPLC